MGRRSARHYLHEGSHARPRNLLGGKVDLRNGSSIGCQRMVNTSRRLPRLFLITTGSVFVSVVLFSNPMHAQEGTNQNSYADGAAPLLTMPGADAPERTGAGDIVDSTPPATDPA